MYKISSLIYLERVMAMLRTPCSRKKVEQWHLNYSTNLGTREVEGFVCVFIQVSY